MADFGRWLDRDAAAAYLCVRLDAFRRMQKAGKLPSPSYQLGPNSPRWDRDALDSAFQGKVASTNAREAVASVVQDILREGREKRARSQAASRRRVG